VVERSNDGARWNELGRVKATVATGNTAYELTDNNPMQGRNFYRLRMVSADGSYQLSAIRQLVFGKSAGAVSIMPNPAQNITVVVFDEPTGEPVVLKLTDGFGRIVATYNIPSGTVHYPVSVATFARGMYYLDIEGNTVRTHLKLILQ
jgi:hypothetical protein